MMRGMDRIDLAHDMYKWLSVLKKEIKLGIS